MSKLVLLVLIGWISPFAIYAQTGKTEVLSEGAALVFKNINSTLTIHQKNLIFPQLELNLSDDKKNFVSIYDEKKEHPFGLKVSLLDLNSDGVEEIFISYGTDEDIAAKRVGNEKCLLIKTDSGLYQEHMNFSYDNLSILNSSNQGYPDLLTSFQNKESSVWRWDGQDYKKYRDVAYSNIKLNEVTSIEQLSNIYKATKPNQLPFIGTWVGNGYELTQNNKYYYTSKLIIENTGNKDTLSCLIFVQALNGNKIVNAFRFKATIKNNLFLPINSSFGLGPSYNGNKALAISKDNIKELFGYFKVKNGSNAETCVYLRYTKTSNSSEKPLSDGFAYEMCASKVSNALMLQNKGKEISEDYFAETATPCLVEQLNMNSATYTYQNTANLLTVSICGLSPIELTVEPAIANQLINNKERNTINFKKIKELSFSDINEYEMLMPTQLIISNPLLKNPITYPQEGKYTNFESLFKKEITSSENISTNAASSFIRQKMNTTKLAKDKDNPGTLDVPIHSPASVNLNTLVGGKTPEELGIIILRALKTNNKSLWINCLHPTDTGYRTMSIRRFNEIRQKLAESGVGQWNLVKFSRVTYNKSGFSNGEDGGVVQGEQVRRYFTIEFDYGNGYVGAVGLMTIQTYKKGKYFVFFPGINAVLVRK